mmetsp:Transcript_56566/g.151443  ORF Transcript_56566/g.151443 Transcript_56566/m.151443 type:complete len:488 (-) Transcript_56566:73-1536(-)
MSTIALLFAAASTAHAVLVLPKGGDMAVAPPISHLQTEAPISRVVVHPDGRTLQALYIADGPVPLELVEPTENTTGRAMAKLHPAPIQLYLMQPAEFQVRARDAAADPDGAPKQETKPAEATKTVPTVHGRSWGAILIRMAIVLGAALIIFGVLSMYHESIYQRTLIKVEHVCCAAYAALSISIDLSIKNAARVNGGKYSFNPACAVVTVEVLKLVASLILFGSNARSDLKEGKTIVWPGLVDIAWLMVPGFVYTCNNIIVFQAIGHCPLGAFGVIRETMLIWNAVLWTIVFRAPIGRMRWFAIALLFLGCVVNQLPAFFHADFSFGVCWAFLLAFSNAAGGVANEYAMKRKAAMDINLQNCILYFFCGTFGMIYLLAFQLDDLQSGFFNGFSPQCIQVVVLQMLTGLAVSRILKYVDAVTKTIVAALRGPGVIFFGAWIFHTQLHWSEVVATIVVCVACYIYLREGPLVKPKEESMDSPSSAKVVK